MKRFLLFVFVAAALAGCDTTVKKSELESVDYGPRPQHWQAEIRDYLKIRLMDPTAAIVEFRAGPTQLYQRETPLRKKEWGWAVCVWVNDKNTSGNFAGFYPMTFFFRNEKIVQVNSGPDDFGVGAQYARSQCEQLGAPFKQKP